VRDYAWTRRRRSHSRRRTPSDQCHQTLAVLDRPERVGRAVETGFLEHLWNAPTKDVYDYTEDADRQLEHPDEVIVGFERGVAVSIDGNPVSMLQAIEELNRRAGAQGVGRLDVVEDRLVGIKSREIYEAPGRWCSSPRTPNSSTSPWSASWAGFKTPDRPALGRARLRRAVVFAVEGGPRDVRR